MKGAEMRLVKVTARILPLAPSQVRVVMFPVSAQGSVLASETGPNGCLTAKRSSPPTSTNGPVMLTPPTAAYDERRDTRPEMATRLVMVTFPMMPPVYL